MCSCLERTGRLCNSCSGTAPSHRIVLLPVDVVEPEPCEEYWRGWRCTRDTHTGPCALVPRWWNVLARIRFGSGTRPPWRMPAPR